MCDEGSLVGVYKDYKSLCAAVICATTVDPKLDFYPWHRKVGQLESFVYDDDLNTSKVGQGDLVFGVGWGFIHANLVCARKIASPCVQQLRFVPIWLIQNWIFTFWPVRSKSRSNRRWVESVSWCIHANSVSVRSLTFRDNAHKSIVYDDLNT